MYKENLTFACTATFTTTMTSDIAKITFHFFFVVVE